MTTKRRKSLWERWKQGVWTLAYAWCTVLVGYLIPFRLAELVLSWLDSWPVVAAVLGVVMFVAWGVLAPLFLSRLKLGATAAREDLAAALEPHVDEMAVRMGADWQGHYLVEVEQLLCEGKSNQARKLYRNSAGVTWDDADRALADWPRTVLTKKLEFLSTRLASTERRRVAV